MRPPCVALAALAIGLVGCDVRSMARVTRTAAPSPRRIPNGPDAPVARDDERIRLAWGRTHMLGGYERVGRRDPKWDAHARTLIDLSIPSLLGSAFDPPYGERLTAGWAAVAAGCDDPLILYLHGRSVWASDPGSAEPEELFRRAVEGMKSVPYDRAIARQAATALYGRFEERRESVGLRPRLQSLELDWFRRSLSDGSYGPDDDLVLTWHLMYGVSAAFVRRSNQGVSEAIDAAEWVDPWVKLHFSGLKHSRAAWAARGHGFASEVKPENWEPFAKESALARVDLEESWRLRPDRPEAAYEMIQISSDAPADGEDQRLWFDRVVRAQMDYLPAYEAMWIHLLPRWGGSHEEMLALGREALETGRFDTEVPAQLLLIVLRIREDQRADDGEGGPPVFERSETYPLLTKMFEGYLAEPARAWEKARWHSLWSMSADRAGRPQDARRHLEAAGNRLAEQARFLVGKEERPSDFVARVVLAASPAAGEVARAARHREAFEGDEALAAYRAAMAKDTSPHVAAALAAPIASLELEKELSSGNWVRFLPSSSDLAGWRTELGSWRREDDGSLVGRAGSRGLLIVADARVGADFEIRGRMELVSSTNGFFQGGVVFGHPSWDGQDWMSFRIMRTPDEGQVAYFGQHFYGAPGGPFPLPVPDRNSFTVRVRNRELSATVNGTAIAGQAPARGLVAAPDLRVGFGGYVDENLVSMRFRDVELRRLPPP